VQVLMRESIPYLILSFLILSTLGVKDVCAQIEREKGGEREPV
jgi:hypothetical protein